MLKRYDVQRQHVIESLDNLLCQLHTLSFFLSPTLLPLLCRIAGQFIFYRPRDLDSKLSLRVWLLLVCAFNAPSFWSHVKDSATESRAVILDFVGMGYLPSKLHLVLLDTLILCLQMLLTTISFEISLRLSSSNPTSSAIPPSPVSSPTPTSPLGVDPNDGDGQKCAHHHPPVMIIDLRIRHIMNHLQNPILLVPRADLTTLPLPNTTPTPRTSMRPRGGEEGRRRVPDNFDPTEVTNDAMSGDVGRIPGGIFGSEQTE